MGTSSAFLCLDPLPLLPSMLHSHDLISPAACCRDTHRNRWLQSNIFLLQGCSRCLRLAQVFTQSFSEVGNNREQWKSDKLVKASFHVKNKEDMLGIGLRLWSWWSGAIIASLAIGCIWKKYGTYGCCETPTSKLMAKHLLSWCCNGRRLLRPEIDEVQLRCSC